MTCWLDQIPHWLAFVAGIAFGVLLIPGILAAIVFLGEWLSSDDKRYRKWLDGSMK